MLPPGLHSQQAGTILPTLMLVPPAVPPERRETVYWDPLRFVERSNSADRPLATYDMEFHFRELQIDV